MKLKCNYCDKKLNRINNEKHERICKIIYDENLYKMYSQFHKLFNYEITWKEYLTRFNIGVSTFSKYRRYNNIPVNGNLKKYPHSEETINKMKLRGGGYRRGSGRGKSGWYKNYWCDSTYELCWLIYQLDNGNIPKRMCKYYEYYYNV